MSKIDSIQLLRKHLDATEDHRLKSPEEIGNEIHAQRMKGTDQVRKLRWWLCGIITIIALAHLVILYWFINKNGHNNILHNLPFISDKVMITFLGTTTADVFGLLYILVKFLFSNHSK